MNKSSPSIFFSRKVRTISKKEVSIFYAIANTVKLSIEYCSGRVRLPLLMDPENKNKTKIDTNVLNI